MRLASSFLLLGLLVVPLMSAAQDEAEAEQPKRESPALPPGLAPAGSGEQGDEDDPALPEGLGGAEEGDDGPALPEGLGGEQQDEPALPAGLGGEGESAETAEKTVDTAPLGGLFDAFTGFWDVRAGVRLRDDPNQRSTSLGETRLQLSRDSYFGPALFRVTADLVYDNVADSHKLQPEQGRGWLDLREAYVEIGRAHV